jgi:hypothetical protein
MPTKRSWQKLNHTERVRILASTPFQQIIDEYELPGRSSPEFLDVLAREHRLWNPENVGEFKVAGRAPTKDVILGAWRDLERSEALLELIDNSIDAWLQRRAKYSTKSADELSIYIDIHDDVSQLTYEDNAGGISTDKLEHLVVPGYSDTAPLSATIGSYKTGGKKAVFRLATAAQILTRYWNPAGSSDETISIHLDDSWLEDRTKYEFPYAVLKDKSVIEKGQTQYVLQLREEPVGGPPWFDQPDRIDKITTEIQKAYSLLLVRNPDINIYFLNRKEPLKPLERLYNFSGTNTSDVDIRPQKVTFETELEYGGLPHPVNIEVVLGCRTTTGIQNGATWGIDLYGNDRLFVAYDQELFSSFFPAGNSRQLVRGFVNIHGGNVFVPWDTHKRHLNVDRDIINILTKHPLIAELFDNWKATYNAISRSGQVTKIIDTEQPKHIDTKQKDYFIPNMSSVKLLPQRKRGVSLPTSVFVPKAKASGKTHDTITVPIKLTSSEARVLAAKYSITGEIVARGTVNDLATEIKADVLKRAGYKNS